MRRSIRAITEKTEKLVNGMKKSKTLTTKVHDAILEKIINAGNESEHMLLTERELVEEYNVSKAPVREALLMLCSEGVLNSIPRCGYVVTRVGEKTGDDNRFVRALLEINALDACFDQITGEDIAQLRECLKDAEEACSSNTDVWTVWEYNQEFHCLLIGIKGNQQLVEHLRKCLDVDKHFMAQNHWKTVKNFKTVFHPEVHAAIVDAIESGNKKTALRLLKRDIGTKI